ncbi:hypothetical protein Naga_100047g41 [Nannochloropsis gaditana]|uniref:Uncharacterized protein n=1 Tax=Nannochloropsis gaditana TaxID=72520 RepID=W7TDD4_9STRA|nr:hypothetical protein Naga_100047g41 [Nannochloropsis gaditana]
MYPRVPISQVVIIVVVIFIVIVTVISVFIGQLRISAYTLLCSGLTGILLSSFECRVTLMTTTAAGLVRSTPSMFESRDPLDRGGRILMHFPWRIAVTWPV